VQYFYSLALINKKTYNVTYRKPFQISLIAVAWHACPCSKSEGQVKYGSYINSSTENLVLLQIQYYKAFLITGCKYLDNGRAPNSITSCTTCNVCLEIYNNLPLVTPSVLDTVKLYNNNNTHACKNIYTACAHYTNTYSCTHTHTHTHTHTCKCRLNINTYRHKYRQTNTEINTQSRHKRVRWKRQIPNVKVKTSY